ncbi:hypothetical protein IEQ34_020469 [Dendrobium chrysotoxum]|uniref:Glycosyl transferase 48 domain-containing protein n=1 Tax=Dendrobium chrysotoxum TaxID=161865 RepID=A0AAV7G2U7_DENCH|nr:hypothetical protein IEQ34_020469 [Dendrobium chrysotoxum]
MRNLLEELNEDHGLRPPTILGVRGHIFAESISSLGWFMSNQETSFVTIGQRVLATPLKVCFQYRHADVFDRIFHIIRGDISKASRGINLNESQTRSPSIAASQEGLLCRRLAVLCSSLSLVSISSSPMKAEEKKGKEDEGDNGVIGAITSLFDPNETTKTGKVLPKAYVKAAREVVKTLKASLEEDAKDVAKFRRSADAAKEAIREYLNGWQGQKVVVTEESYAALEKAIRSLANFYSKAGPFAPLSEEVKSNILEYLNTADANI